MNINVSKSDFSLNIEFYLQFTKYSYKKCELIFLVDLTPLKTVYNLSQANYPTYCFGKS